MKRSCYYSTKHLYAQIGVRGGYVHHSVFIFSTRSVLLILFYHLTAFGQPRYGDIGQSGLAWMCIPYKKRDFSASGTCVPCRKIPPGLLLYSFITSRKSEVFPSRIPENPFPVHWALHLSGRCTRKQVSVLLPEMYISRRNIPDHGRKDPHH